MDIKDNIKQFLDSTKGFYTGEAGSGFVKVTVNEKGYVCKIEYEKNDLITKDLEVFIDLIRIANNSAMDKLREKLGENFNKIF